MKTDEKCAKVIQIDDFRPHWATIVNCEHCGHEWCAVFPLGTKQLECGECGLYTPFQYPVVGHLPISW